MRLLETQPLQVVNYYQGGKYRRILSNGDLSTLVEVESIGDIDEPRLYIHSLIPEGETDIQNPLLNNIKWVLGVDVDLKPFYKEMDRQPETKKLKERLYGLKLIRSQNIFEALVIAISEQQISLRAALTVRKRFVVRYGSSLKYKNNEFHEFPSPMALVDAKEEELRELGFSKNKANAIKTVAKLATSTELIDIFNQPQRDVISEMTKIRGIGKWTVEYALCLGMGRYEVIPTKDLALKKAVRTYYWDENILSDNDVNLTLSRFSEYAGYAAFYFINSYACCTDNM